METILVIRIANGHYWKVKQTRVVFYFEAWSHFHHSSTSSSLKHSDWRPTVCNLLWTMLQSPEKRICGIWIFRSELWQNTGSRRNPRKRCTKSVRKQNFIHNKTNPYLHVLNFGDCINSADKRNHVIIMWHKCICLRILYLYKIYRASVFPLIPCSIRFSFGTNAVYGPKEVSQPEWSQDRKWLCFPCSRCPDVEEKETEWCWWRRRRRRRWRRMRAEPGAGRVVWNSRLTVQLISLTANRAVHRFPINTFWSNSICQKTNAANWKHNLNNKEQNYMNPIQDKKHKKIVCAINTQIISTQ